LKLIDSENIMENTKKKIALITGITGQDGAYLAEFLLEKGYEVHGIKRRASSFNTNRIDHLYQAPDEKNRHFILHYGDLTDATNLIRIIQQIQPDEIYNLAAQSHVAVSFESPEYTANADALGTLRILEAIRILGLEQKTRFYQASTSELFGKVQEIPQKETTPFYPRSPYAVAKLYAYWITVNYREAYGIYGCNGILFNHECIASNTPLLVRTNNIVNVVSPDELVPLRHKGPNIQFFETPHISIWDGQDWTPIAGITATKRRKKDAEHTLLSVQARHGILDATAHHRFLNAGFDIVKASQLQVGEQLALTDRFPETPAWTRLTKEMAQFLGLMTADGYISAKDTRAQFTNNDENLRRVVATLWSQLFLGNSKTAASPSGFSENTVGQLYLSGASTQIAWLREQLYSKRSFKRVPPLILNAPLETQAAYLEGYYAGDGLKAGKNDSVKTNSTLLAQGLYWLYANQGRLSSVYLEQRNGHAYYQLNIPSKNLLTEKGQHLCKEPAEIRHIAHTETANEWVFDLETGSGVFMAGVGRMIVHNSPIRGETFVTRKITRALARIKLGLQDCLYLGNLNAKRDWGHARDYVEMQWLMLQQEEPDDYVIATGLQYSVRDFVEEACQHLDMKIRWQGTGVDEKGYDEKTGQCVVAVEPRYFRPTEVETLLGDPTKAKEKLGWEPQITFEQLVEEMIKEDLKLAEQDAFCQWKGYKTFKHYE
jgi:GDPmannose 4,6-dehydratase